MALGRSVKNTVIDMSEDEIRERGELLDRLCDDLKDILAVVREIRSMVEKLSSRAGATVVII